MLYLVKSAQSLVGSLSAVFMINLTVTLSFDICATLTPIFNELNAYISLCILSLNVCISGDTSFFRGVNQDIKTYIFVIFVLENLIFLTKHISLERSDSQGAIFGNCFVTEND